MEMNEENKRLNFINFIKLNMLLRTLFISVTRANIKNKQ